MKTIKEWLESLPEPHRKQALANCHKIEQRKAQYSNPILALKDAFSWTNSPQGYEYWEGVGNHMAWTTKLPKPIFAPAPTNALSALHAIALKKGFPVEQIMGIGQCGAPGDWWYSLEDGVEHLINLKTE
jgi:hypothetical protein